ncbi:MAG: GNAT family N-acetyltransferase [Polaromonas sp.]|nr:GNAT family N-acetyltransferase [Polaromonas sp.]
MHIDYYAEAAVFGLNFEITAACDLADFCSNFDAQRDGLWLGLVDGRIDASIAIDGRGPAEGGAHLRWFVASEHVRGSGLGTQWLRSALDFCDGGRHPNLVLWTFDRLPAARHSYEKHGFALRLEQVGIQWGRPFNEQRFERGQPSA